MSDRQKSTFWQAFWGLLGPGPVKPSQYTSILIPPTADNAWRMVGVSLTEAANKIKDKAA